MGTMGKGLIGTVFKKSRAKKATILDTGFKVRDIDAEDGKMKMKKVSGLRRSAIRITKQFLEHIWAVAFYVLAFPN